MFFVYVVDVDVCLGLLKIWVVMKVVVRLWLIGLVVGRWVRVNGVM